MTAVTPLSFGETREQSKPAIWDRTHLGVVMPLCIIVTVAIVCIVVAALTAAQRANEVAIEHEKELFTRSLVNRGEWSLRKLKTIIAPDEAAGEFATINTGQALRRIGQGFKTLIDHDFILLNDTSGHPIYSLISRDTVGPEWMPANFPELASTLAYLRGQNSTPPNKIVWLTEPKWSADGAYVGEVVFLQMLMNRLAIISSVVTGPNSPQFGNGRSPAVLAVMFVDDAILTDISGRLQLANLRKIDGEPVPTGDYVLNLVDDFDQPVVRFAWSPHRPASVILYSVVPFIAIAFIGFALLAATMLRHMRRTSAAIVESESRLRHLALHDPLCGLPNRHFFLERLESVIAQVRCGGPPTAVFYIDLDHFKDVNDTLGHPIGDELIRSVTSRLAHTLRGDDLVARLGGDEFAIITTAASDSAMLQIIAKRIIAMLCAPYMINGHTIVIGTSIGIAFIDQSSADNAADIMRYADMALYRAKNEGRNRACIYDTAMDADLSRRKLLEQDLREAIENNQLHVSYQPIVNASGEKIVGVEALARWLHPERGLISPVEFIPLAEHGGLIVKLGEWVLRQACRDGKNWPELSVAVNVSPMQFRQIDFVEAVKRILAETGFDPVRLELEITESTLIGNVEIAESAMLRLKALGVRLALDDFGTGYSSLLYLRRFPFDKLKIDRSFVASIEKATEAATIVHAIVSLGRGLGMKVTAEGVENAEQHLFLRAAGVHYMQGFRFGKPSSAADITACLATPGAYRGIARDAVAAMAG